MKPAIQGTEIDVAEYGGVAALYTRPVMLLQQVPWLWNFVRVTVPFAVLIAVWHVLAAMRIYSEVLFPGPLVVARSAWIVSASGVLLTNITASLWNLGLGFVVGAGIAIPLGLAMGLMRGLAAFFEPVISFFQAIPGLAWIPLAILWLGAGQASVVFIIFTSVFFPVLYSMLAGVRGVEPAMTDAARTMGASTLTIIRHVIIPSSLPNLVTGLRLSVGYGFRTLVAGEMVVATKGLGYMIFDARSYMRSDLIMVGMIVIGLLWLALDRIFLVSLERRTIQRWGLIGD